MAMVGAGETWKVDNYMDKKDDSFDTAEFLNDLRSYGIKFECRNWNCTHSDIDSCVAMKDLKEFIAVSQVNEELRGMVEPLNIKLNYLDIYEKLNSYTMALKYLQKNVDCEIIDEEEVIDAVYGYLEANDALFHRLELSRVLVLDFMKKDKKKIDDSFAKKYHIEPVKVDENR